MSPLIGLGLGATSSALQKEGDIPWWATTLGGGIGLGLAGRGLSNKLGTLEGIKKTFGGQKGMARKYVEKYGSPAAVGIWKALQDKESGEDIE
jgi:hypothetical protein